MTRKQEMWMALIAAIVIVVLCVMCSCKTTKTITETVYTHDTLTIHKIDTVKEVKIKEVHDTVKQAEAHYFTLNNVGDTIKEIHHYHNTIKTIIVDSTERYKAKVDSLQNVIDNQKETVKIVKKGFAVPWWVWIVLPAILILGIFYIAKWIIQKRWHLS